VAVDAEADLCRIGVVGAKRTIGINQLHQSAAVDPEPRDIRRAVVEHVDEITVDRDAGRRIATGRDSIGEAQASILEGE
jgi:hypothetical protein